MLLIIPPTTRPSTPAARRCCSSGVPTKPFGAAFLEHRLARDRLDGRMDLDTLGAWPHERRVGRVPDVLKVHDWLSGGTERVQHPTGGPRRLVRIGERIRAAREVVALDVDDQ